MELFGGISVQDDGKTRSILAMNTQMKMLQMHTNNIANFGLPGFQKDIIVKNSFAEHIGVHALDKVKDTTPGRMRSTGNPLDLAINSRGYFQVKTPEGVKLTKDGRSKIDKDGYLVTVNDQHFLGSDGEPLKFSFVPYDHKDIKIDENGTINIYNRSYNSKELVGRMSIVSEDGTPIEGANVVQGYIEESNVNLAGEFFELMPVRRNFEANKQAYLLMKENVDKALQNLGKPQ